MFITLNLQGTGARNELIQRIIAITAIFILTTIDWIGQSGVFTQ